MREAGRSKFLKRGVQRIVHALEHSAGLAPLSRRRAVSVFLSGFQDAAKEACSGGSSLGNAESTHD